MTGPKLNEKSFVAGERSGTKASALYVHVGAWKAREVLNLIRGLPVREADELLQFTDREVAGTVRKVLASAVANAIHNDEQDAEELYVKACFADEGPTLKRFTPRARGRAGRIKKRTCHITVLVARLDDDRLEIVQARFAKRSAAGRRGRGAVAGSSQSRRARVERSRARAAGLADPTSSTGAATDDELAEGTESDHAADQVTNEVAGQVVTDQVDTVLEDAEGGIEADADVTVGDEASPGVEPQPARAETDADDEPATGEENN